MKEKLGQKFGLFGSYISFEIIFNIVNHEIYNIWKEAWQEIFECILSICYYYLMFL